MRLLTYIPIILLLFCLSTCKKDIGPTTLSIKVTDKKTKEPIKGVTIDVRFSREESKQGSLVTIEDRHLTGTNDNGTVDVTTDDFEFYSVWGTAWKQGYVDVSGFVSTGNIKKEQKNDVNLEMVPRDGLLKLTVQNVNGLKDTIYANIYSLIEKSVENNYRGQVLKQYPLILKKGESYTEDFNIPAPDSVKIQWSLTRPTYQKPFQYNTTVSLRDTTTYLLTY